MAYKTKLQPTVAQSSTEAEFMQATDAGRISLFIRSILWDLNIPQEAATILYEDNDGATAMANAGKPTPRSRHIDVKFYVIQEWVERDLMKLERIDTAVNMADHFTKPLPRILFYRHRDFYMGHVPPTYSPRYNEVARVYAIDNDITAVDHKPLTARAASTIGPWDSIISQRYLSPMASCRTDSTSSSERGGVTDITRLTTHDTVVSSMEPQYQLLTYSR